ncbi:MAG: hypothetical protein PQ975_09090 [Methanobacterium sp.]|jgi:hypothetical protein
MTEMGLFRNQNTRKNKKNGNLYDNLIDEINNCKIEGLESLLQKIEAEIEKHGGKDRNLLSAKTMVTSKIALKNSK